MLVASTFPPWSQGMSTLSTIWLWLGSCFYVLKRPRWRWCTMICRRGSRRAAECCQGSREAVNSSPHSEADSLLGDTEKEAAASISARSHLRVFISKLRPLLPILGVFLPIIVFWAIMYQQNSTWVVQGLEMDCYIGTVQVPPGVCVCVGVGVGVGVGVCMCVWVWVSMCVCVGVC